MVAQFVGVVGQPSIVRLMPELPPTGSGVLALFLLVRGKRLGRGARIFIGPLEPQHQLDQLLFAQMLQITAVHPTMDSEIAARGKGVGNYSGTALWHHPGRFVLIRYASRAGVSVKLIADISGMFTL